MKIDLNIYKLSKGKANLSFEAVAEIRKPKIEEFTTQKLKFHFQNKQVYDICRNIYNNYGHKFFLCVLYKSFIKLVKIYSDTL